MQDLFSKYLRRSPTQLITKHLYAVQHRTLLGLVVYEPPKFYPSITIILVDLLCSTAANPPLFFSRQNVFGQQSTKVIYHHSFMLCGTYLLWTPVDITQVGI